MFGTELCPLPQNSSPMGLIPNMTIFGDKDFRKVIKVNWGHKDGSQI